MFKPLAKALIRLHVCAGWSEPLLVAHTTLLEISCHGSIIFKEPTQNLTVMADRQLYSQKFCQILLYTTCCTEMEMTGFHKESKFFFRMNPKIRFALEGNHYLGIKG